jgi:hypothetical protein
MATKTQISGKTIKNAGQGSILDGAGTLNNYGGTGTQNGANTTAKPKTIQVGARKIDVTGLNDAQIQQVIKASANGKGSLASRALAEKLRGVPSTTNGKKNTGINYNKPVPGKDLQVNPKDGTVGPGAVSTISGSEISDVGKTFGSANPGEQEDIYGNNQKIVRNPDGSVRVTQGRGGPLDAAIEGFRKLMGSYNTDFSSQVKGAQDANYNYITQNYGKQKQQEIDNAKQELANQGIPLDPNPNSLYGRTLSQIDQKYQSLDDQAHNQGIMSGNQTLESLSGVQNQNLNTVAGVTQNFKPQFTDYNSGAGKSDLSGTLTQLLQIISGAAQGNKSINASSDAQKAQLELQKLINSQNQEKDSGVVFNG